MPEPIEGKRRYMPGLDGLRAIAVLGVIAYHLGFSWIPGGLLGVGVFFTLSGYLITDLLLGMVNTGGIRFAQFWLARARRLLPALLLMLVLVLAWVTVIGPHQGSDFPASVLTGTFYVNNWWLIFHKVSYFQRVGAPPPLNHLWSLSVEEQFYIVWPLILLLGVKFIPDSKAAFLRPKLALATFGLALVSAVLMGLMYKAGSDPSRVYYGTDTRAQELLVGAALAMVWPSQKLRARINSRARNIIDGAGVFGLLVVLVMFFATTEKSPFLYRGGFLLLSIGTCILVASLAHPASRVALAVGCSPMKWIGERSYGIYLWHFPVIALTTPAGSKGVDPIRTLLQLIAIFGISALSWKFVEDPIRHGALGRLWTDWRGGRWSRQTLTRAETGGLVAGGLILLVAMAGLAGFGTDSKANGRNPVTKAVTSAAVPLTANHTSCKSVVHIGDSTSLGLDDPSYIPRRKDRISGQYARVGATTAYLDISDARSVVEKVENRPNAQEAALGLQRKNKGGCWVLALGLNEADDVYDHSPYGFAKRIDLMMQIIGKDPVMWVNVKTLLSDGGYSNSLMQQWNAAVVAACDKYPNMRAYDWPSDVLTNWYTTDQIHFTSEGYTKRARYIADALLKSFPATGGPGNTNSKTCLIHPEQPAAAAAASTPAATSTTQ
jgi:peptidoglycan/LPS O-acetylase OafA/YrhL